MGPKGPEGGGERVGREEEKTKRGGEGIGREGEKAKGGGGGSLVIQIPIKTIRMIFFFFSCGLGPV